MNVQEDYSAGGLEREAADEELHPWHARCGHVYGLSADMKLKLRVFEMGYKELYD